MGLFPPEPNKCIVIIAQNPSFTFRFTRCCPGLQLLTDVSIAFSIAPVIGTWSLSDLGVAAPKEALWLYFALGHGFHELV